MVKLLLHKGILVFIFIVMSFGSVLSQVKVFVTFEVYVYSEHKTIGSVLQRLALISREYSSNVEFIIDINRSSECTELLHIREVAHGVLGSRVGKYKGTYSRGVIELEDGSPMCLFEHELGHWLGLDHSYHVFNKVMVPHKVPHGSRLSLSEWRLL